MNANNDYKRKAVSFLKKYNIQDLNWNLLQEIIYEQGYEVVEYNVPEKSLYLNELFKELDLYEFALQNKAFTYKNGNIKIVFLDGTLNDNEKLRALIHEEGHIFCGHMEHVNCSCANIDDEWEANEFAHYIFKPPITFVVSNSIKKKRSVQIIIVIILIAIVLAFVLSGINNARKREYVQLTDYYITQSGEKYHTKDCRFIEDNDDIRRLTLDEYNSGNYTPCSVCNPEEEK